MTGLLGPKRDEPGPNGWWEKSRTEVKWALIGYSPDSPKPRFTIHLHPFPSSVSPSSSRTGDRARRQQEWRWRRRQWRRGQRSSTLSLPPVRRSGDSSSDFFFFNFRRLSHPSRSLTAAAPPSPTPSPILLFSFAVSCPWPTFRWIAPDSAVWNLGTVGLGTGDRGDEWHGDGLGIVGLETGGWGDECRGDGLSLFCELFRIV